MSEADPGDFVRRFTAWWAAPDPATLDVLLAEDAVLVQPLLPTTIGLDRGRESMSRMLAAIPDLTATVHRWAASGSVVYVEFTLTGTLGGRPLAWANVDRISLGPDGRATERINYHDSAALALRMLGRPRAWNRLVRSGIFSR